MEVLNMDKLACPILLLVNAIQPAFATPDEKYGCFDNCAWYDDENECCALMTLARKGGTNREGEAADE
jgi:hypothetical protein